MQSRRWIHVDHSSFVDQTMQMDRQTVYGHFKVASDEFDEMTFAAINSFADL